MAKSDVLQACPHGQIDHVNYSDMMISDTSANRPINALVRQQNTISLKAIGVCCARVR